MTDHRKLLQAAGEALYGARWQSELARDLNIADRTMRRWIADPHELPSPVWGEIEKLLIDRSVTIDRLRQQLSSNNSG